MTVHEFTIIASGLHPERDDLANRFFEAGCDDATIAFQKGVIILEFAREAQNFTHALVSAVENVGDAGACVERIEPDYLVSLSDIAKRAGMSRAAISLYANGERAVDFPRPVARVTSESPLWDWLDVARWLHKAQKVTMETVFEAKLVRDVNLAIMAGEYSQTHLGKKLFESGKLEAACA